MMAGSGFSEKTLERHAKHGRSEPATVPLEQFTPKVRYIIEHSTEGVPSAKQLAREFKEQQEREKERLRLERKASPEELAKAADRAAARAEIAADQILERIARCEVLGSGSGGLELRLLYDPAAEQLLLACRPVGDRLAADMPPEHQWRILHLMPARGDSVRLIRRVKGRADKKCGNAMMVRGQFHVHVYGMAVRIRPYKPKDVLALLRLAKDEIRTMDDDKPLRFNEPAMKEVLAAPALAPIRATPSPVSAAQGEDYEEDFTEEDLARLRGEPVRRERMRD